MITEFDHIEECLKIIAEKYDWGKYENWSTQQFDALSFDIKKVSGTTISSRTLQRLTSHRIKYSPQTGTKNALAKYIGYQNWEDFMLSMSKTNDNLTSKTKKVKKSKINSFVIGNFWLIQFLLIIVLSSFFLFFFPSIEREIDKNKIVFQSNDIKGTAPHSASFFYDVSKFKSGNVFFDYDFYGEGNLIPLKKNIHYYHTTFNLPNYYATKIIANGNALSGVNVHVVTDGWETIINNKLYKNINSIESGYLHVDNKTIRDLNINADNLMRVDFRNVRDFGVSGDAMTLEIRFMNNLDIGGQGCYDSKIEIMNEKGRMSFNFVTPGCDEQLIEAKFGDIYLAGEFNDLNTFFQDISYWRVLKIVSGNKRIGLFLDEVQIYSVLYNQSLEDVKGLSVSFLGSGAVDYVKLYNEGGQLVYNNDFGY